MESIWRTYVKHVAGDVTQTAIFERTGISQPTIGRWIHGEKTPTEAAQVAKFAQAYGRNVLEAFVAAGMLSEKDASAGLPDESRLTLKRVRRAAAEEVSSRSSSVDHLRGLPSAAEPPRKDDGSGADYS